MKFSIKRYIRNVAVGFDNFVNAITGGDPDETMSSRLGKRKDKLGFKQVYLAVNWVARVIFRQKDHCEDSIEKDEGKDAVLD